MRALLLLVFLASCSRALDLPADQAPAAAIDCTTLTTASSCLAAGCAVGVPCACSGGFPGCFPSDAQPNSASSCPVGCETPIACSAIDNEAACTARPDCFSLYTLSEPCNSEGCPSHFVTCQLGKPWCGDTCPDAVGGTCDPGFVVVSTDGACALGCVVASVCGD